MLCLIDLPRRSFELEPLFAIASKKSVKSLCWGGAVSLLKIEDPWDSVETLRSGLSPEGRPLLPALFVLPQLAAQTCSFSIIVKWASGDANNGARSNATVTHQLRIVPVHGASCLLLLSLGIPSHPLASIPIFRNVELGMLR